MNSSTLPNIEYHLDILGEDKANDCSADVFLLEQGLTHFLDDFVALIETTFVVGDKVGQRLLPSRGSASSILNFPQVLLVRKSRQIALVDRLHH